MAESAFMTGLEANSGIVRMASYAPLLVNTHMRGWSPDMIVFDNHRCALLLPVCCYLLLPQMIKLAACCHTLV